MDTGSRFSMLLMRQPTRRRRRRLAVLSAFDQLISIRYTITGMNAADTTHYIRPHLKFAGRSYPLFSDDAIHAISLASWGYPRAVDNLAFAALIATLPPTQRPSTWPRRNRRSLKTADEPASPLTTTTSPS